MAAASQCLVQAIEKRHTDLKETDQLLALSVGALAGIPTRDRRGNVLDALWVKYSEQSVVGMLLETDDIRKILLGQIQEQLKARQDLIQQVEQNEIVCQWLMAFTSSWEREYSKQIVAQFDIGQLVLSAMSETYFEIVGLLDHSPAFARGAQNMFTDAIGRAVATFESEARDATALLADVKQALALSDADLAAQLARIHAPLNRSTNVPELVREATEDHAQAVRDPRAEALHLGALAGRRIHKGDEAAVRLLFRHDNTRSLMCRVAGATLRQQEVCNKAGAYSAKVQRNDIAQQKSAALDTFCAWVLTSDARLRSITDLLRPGNEKQLIELILDHKGTQTFSDGLHLSHGRA